VIFAAIAQPFFTDGQIGFGFKFQRCDDMVAVIWFSQTDSIVLQFCIRYREAKRYGASDLFVACTVINHFGCKNVRICPKLIGFRFMP